MDSNNNDIRKVLGMPFVSAEVINVVEFLFTRWEKEINDENHYLLMMTTPLESSFINLIDDDKDKLSELAIKLTGEHNTGVSQRGYIVYYPKRPNYDVVVSAENYGLVEYRQKIDMKIDVEYLQEKIGKFLHLCSSWYVHKGFNDAVLLTVMLTNAEKINLVKNSSAYSQSIPESLILSYQSVSSSKLSDITVKSRTIHELKGAFNIF